MLRTKTPYQHLYGGPLKCFQGTFNISTSNLGWHIPDFVVYSLWHTWQSASSLWLPFNLSAVLRQTTRPGTLPEILCVFRLRRKDKPRGPSCSLDAVLSSNLARHRHYLLLWRVWQRKSLLTPQGHWQTWAHWQCVPSSPCWTTSFLEDLYLGQAWNKYCSKALSTGWPEAGQKWVPFWAFVSFCVWRGGKGWTSQGLSPRHWRRGQGKCHADYP